MSNEKLTWLSGLLALVLLGGLGATGFAHDPPTPVGVAVELAGRADEITDDLSLTLGEYAEPALAEYRSLARVTEYLASAGFTVQAGVGGVPTALVASWGTGKPVLGVRAGLNAARTTGSHSGGNLEAAAAVAAAIALKEGLREINLPGTVKLFLYPTNAAFDAGPAVAAAGHFAELDALISACAGAANHGDPLSSEALRAAGYSEFTVSESGTTTAGFTGHASGLVPTAGFLFSAEGARSAWFAAKALSALGMSLLTNPEALTAVQQAFQRRQTAAPTEGIPANIPEVAFPEAPGITVRRDGMVRFVASPSVGGTYVMVPGPLKAVSLGAYDCGV